MQKLSVLIVGMLVVAGLFTVPLRAQTQNNQTTPVVTSPVYTDQLDQKQETTSSNAILPIGRVPVEGFLNNVQVAQSFVPTKAVLTRVQLEVGKNTSTNHSLTVSIRKDLNGADLAQVSVPPEQFQNLNFSWVEFNVPDCWVVPGSTYYIVCTTENISDSWFIWAGTNDSTAYPNGCAWVSLDGVHWNSTSTGSPAFQDTTQPCHPASAGNGTWDMCFRTYGMTEATLTYTFTGRGLKITNTGNVTAQDVWWNITITGGLLLLGNRHVNGTLPELTPGNSTMVKLGLLLGFGKLTFTVQAGAANAQALNETKTGLLLLFFLVGIK